MSDDICHMCNTNVWDNNPAEVCNHCLPTWQANAAEFLREYERCGPVEDNCWRPRA